MTSGCEGPAPTAHAAAPAASVPATVTGRVGTSDGSLRVAGRGVEAVNLDTGERHAVVTSRDGDFAMNLRPGTWRLELRLEPGESLARSPAPITVSPSRTPRDVQFVVAPALYRPHRRAAPRAIGLASPIA